jgi:hypothetical protein
MRDGKSMGWIMYFDGPKTAGNREIGDVVD